MIRLLGILSCLMLITACGVSEVSETDSTLTSENYELCGYGPMMIIDGKEYIKVNKQQKVKLDQQLGSIILKIDETLHPVENFTSNTLLPGTAVYSVEDNAEKLIAKTQENEYLLFELIK
ncbi:hypothetical protein GLW08_06600 [Pontibacillus yanchengensis]|uniref:Uncharacterized protein n=2 Tax=Pontibacillus yanchengensis TaxID=462910 RepID=A0ACC7VDZ9_9BACI|nr:hypothetical protein [Pontibacillus yanchengensis]MYL32426.1 hypothetical protein [Pontibacillus yanchengensis]MYL53007.1 hypothetical protein [Pontibacillus yanchengensis]